MSYHVNKFNLPPKPNKEDSTPRRVGFELEFSGISLDKAAEVLQFALEGQLHSESSAQRIIHTESAGKFIIELDWDYLKQKANGSERGEDGKEWLEPLSQVAALLVPVEIVCPPIPITELPILIPMVDALRNAGAVGTEESLIAAYGVHINAEIPSLDVSTLFSYLKAFTLLQWWLVDKHEVDVARKVSPYVDLYPEVYMRQVLSKTESSIDEFFSDYLEYNATRNRALDLLPILAEIDASRIKAAVNDPKIKARPTFHYRLPNCHIERDGWSLTDSWNTWCVIEQLAARNDDLNSLSEKFLEAYRPFLGVSRGDWVKFIDQWLKDHALV